MMPMTGDFEDAIEVEIAIAVIRIAPANAMLRVTAASVEKVVEST